MGARRTRGLEPWRGNGYPSDSRPLCEDAIQRLWKNFERKWGLKHLPPAYLRHWVKTTCRRLSDPALAALQGHQPPKGQGMRNVYDTPTIDAVIDEQRTEFPHGAIGTLKPPTAYVVDGLETEIALLREWKDGRLGMMELMQRLEALQRKTLAAVNISP